MKALEKSFEGKGEVKGFSFRLIKGSNLGYIYEVFAFNSNRWYEVFKHKENSRFNTISYPSQKSFGIWAWTCRDLKRALEVFDAL